MSVRIIFVRHGKTDWNKENKLQGRTDILLNKNGIEQVKKMATELKKSNERPRQIISSPLIRAMQSAIIISDILGIPVMANKNLAERDFGSLEGKTWKEVIAICGPGFKEIDRKQQYDYRPYGGESAEQVGKRILDFIDYASEEYGGKTIIVVTHAGILRFMSFIFHKMGMDFYHDTKPGGCSIIEL